ncbi:hypothetical protein CsatB_000841 [Cannabis sativa]|uniref:uncharacterized protein LOC115696546 n=1 Tax=Cannabis sativa TaxID=3483 RepID=UPI0011DFEAA7|nr:uncharacterized protein LOC115696546 [Cannabis sativa]
MWHSRFHYEQAWDDDEECKSMVKDCWTVGRPNQLLAHLVGSFDRCGQKLAGWNQTKQKLTKQKVKNLKAQVESLSSSTEPQNWKLLSRVERELNCHLAKEEAFWRQRSRALWCKNGDQNTKVLSSASI